MIGTYFRSGLATGGVVFLGLLIGCAGDKPRKPVHPVRGKVTYQGKPMAGALITFGPANEIDPRALHSYARADKDGTYRLTTYERFDGVPAGECVVAIVWPDSRRRKAEATDDEEGLPDRLKGAYAHTATSRLRATVREQDNEINFDLP